MGQRRRGYGYVERFDDEEELWTLEDGGVEKTTEELHLGWILSHDTFAFDDDVADDQAWQLKYFVMYSMVD